jgi:hypothetical protein
MSDSRQRSIPVGILVSVSNSRRRRKVKPLLEAPLDASAAIEPVALQEGPVPVSPCHPGASRRSIWPAVAGFLALAVIGTLFVLNARRPAPPLARIAKAPPREVRAPDEMFVLPAVQRPGMAGPQEGAPQPLGLAAPEPDDDAGVRPPAAKKCNLGTDIVFVDDPPAAFRAATRERKLVMMVHLSGNFEDKEFT